MKQAMKDKINSLDPRVREKLIKRLAAEKIAKKYNVEINFDEIDLDNFAKELADAIRKIGLAKTQV
jgi:hypothetical protein